MLVVTAVLILGLLGGIVAAQLRGLRMGGVVIVPLFAVYTLRTFGTFPVLVMSVIGGYVSVAVVKRRLFLYGRSLFVLSIVTSGLVPLVVYAFTHMGFGPVSAVDELGFIGGILPGIAVYNFHRLSPEERVLDAVWSLALLLLLVVVGIGLVIAVGLTPLATVAPPVLLGPDSDIARAFGLVVEGTTHPVLLPFPTELGLIGLGLGLSHVARQRLGLRLGGLIVVPLVVLFAFRNGLLLPLYVVATVVAYVGIQLLHSWTLLYGRVLLSMGVVFGISAIVSLVPSLSFANGLLPFFTGILGGVSAYNYHALGAPERRPSVLVTAGVFAMLAGVTRLFVTPLPSGMLVDVTPVHVLSGVVVVGLAAREIHRLESIRPTGLNRLGSGWEFEDVNRREGSG